MGRQWILLMCVLALAIAGSGVLTPSSSQVGRMLVLTFDKDEADINDFGNLKPIDLKGWSVTNLGNGCPTNPTGRALNAGYTEEPDARVLAFSIPTDADVTQGTVEMWLKPKWSMGAREGHTLFHIKLRGGYWNGIWVGYHGTIGPTTEAFGANIMDGVDHPAYVGDAEGQLGWKADEWHHIAVTWTDHSLYVFADGKLVAQTFSETPFRIGDNEGVLCIGGSYGFGETKPLAGGLIDEFRFVNLPLYSPDNPPDPMKKVTEPIDLGVAWLGYGARAFADSVAEPELMTVHVPQLCNGEYGDAVSIEDFVVVQLPKACEVSGFEWSRDGVPYAGEKGRGWAHVLPYPLAFKFEVSLDGKSWETVVNEPNFRISPKFVAQNEALRFRFNFAPKFAQYARMTIERKPRGYQFVMLDEIAIYGRDGRNLALSEGVKAWTGDYKRKRRFEPDLAIDGKWGEQSCWKSATKGQGTLTVELPKMMEIQKVQFSRNREGFKRDGTPSAGRVEVSLDGHRWEAVAEFHGAEPKQRTIVFKTTKAKLVRLVITETSDGNEPIIDDLRVQ
ncbi:MAG: discoidin domain-containing protein [Armatimonadetes bacterium]|nr:discoidin domain-containing protein [Armatimonadota bacterium]MDW8121675.1 discoidin domain-containing protein [Armatimonadota bacterium]